MKFKSDIEVQAGIKDYAGSSGTAGQVLSSDGATVTWIDAEIGVASDVQNEVKAGVAINKGQAVYVTSADGTNIIVGLASNTSEATSSKTLGLLNATVAANGFADVVQIGKLSGLNTIGANIGDPVWLGVNGNLIYGLANKPYAPAHLVFIGIVTRVNANNGEIFVTVQNGFELKEIHDVDIITNVPVNGDILGYDGTLWVNKTIAEWLGYVPADDALVVHKAGTETITGTKTFLDNITYFSNNGSYNIELSNPDDAASILRIGASAGTGNITSDGSIGINVGGTINAIGITPNGNTFFSNTITAPAFKTYTGTSSQFLKANGTIDSTVYVPTTRTITINGVTQSLAANQTWTVTGGVSGSGVAGQVAYWDGTTSITGESNLFWDSTGDNLGIGTAIPSRKLHVSATGNNGIHIQTTNEAQITMSGYDSTNSIYYCGYDGTGLYYSPPAAQINKGSSTGATYPINYYSGGDNGNNSYLSLQTQASEKMRITSGGNVGIGTKTVPNTLSVAMASSTTGKGISLTSSAGIEYARFGVINSTVDNTSFIGSISNNNFAIYANNAERMRIFQSGNVFIGSAPADAGYKLDVNGSGRFSNLLQVNGPSATTRSDSDGISVFNGNVDYRLGFDSINGTRGYIRYNVDSALSTHGHIFSGGDWNATPTDLMLIRGDGNVGIGITTGITQKLVVDGGSTDGAPIFAKSSLLSSGKYYSGVLTGFATTTNQSAQFGYVYDTVTPANSFAHITNYGSAEGSQFSIKTNGNVGVGTKNAGVRLVNSGGGNTDGPTFGSGTVGSDAILSGNGLYGLYTGVSNAGHVWQQVQRNDGSTAVYPLSLQTSGGSVLIGTITDAGYKLDVNGSGRFSGKVTASDLITYGIYGPDKSNIDALNTKTDGTAGFISLVGHSGNTSSPYRWGGISGGKTTAVGDGNYGGYLSLWTTSGGENSQADSASYERMRVTSAGNVIIGGTTPRAKLDVEGYTSFVSISAGINSEATTVDQQLAGIDFRKHYALAIGASIRLLQSGGVNNYSTSHLAFYTNDGSTAFNTVPPEKMRITSNGTVLINTQTDAGYRLDVNGNVRASSGFVGNLEGASTYSNMDDFMSNRDFPSGTLIETSINYNVSEGDPFILEIKGNSYGNIIPMDMQIQGYIYANTIINTGGYSNGFQVSGIRAIRYGGNLCFWFPTQGYWNGYTVRVYTAYGGRQANKVTNVTNTGLPTTDKQVFFSPVQSLHSANYNNYTPTLTGTGASGTWGINITGTAGSAPNGSNQNNYYNVTPGEGYGLRFWSSESYKISMGYTPSLYQYGPVTDYSIKTQMDTGSTARGFTWGRDGATPIAALNSTSGNMQVAGTFTATGFFNSSDIRLKDLVDYDYSVSDIKPITYFWKDLRDNKKHIGYSAQEVQKVMPDAVNEGSDGILSVNYIEVLVAKIAELENRIKQLEK